MKYVNPEKPVAEMQILCKMEMNRKALSEMCYFKVKVWSEAVGSCVQGASCRLVLTNIVTAAWRASCFQLPWSLLKTHGCTWHFCSQVTKRWDFSTYSSCFLYCIKQSSSLSQLKPFGLLRFQFQRLEFFVDVLQLTIHSSKYSGSMPEL